MNTVDDYIATVSADRQAAFERISRIVRSAIPDVVQGTSYGMAAFIYKGKPLVSFVARKKFLSLYPFSGKVVEKLADQLVGFECTSGSIHFTVNSPIPESLLIDIVMTRAAEIANGRPS